MDPMTGKTWAAVAAAAAVAGGGWYYARAKAGGGKGGRVEFREVLVSRGDLDVSVLATGTVQPQNRVQIKPPIGGRAEEILVREGERVRKGQILAWMSSSERAALLDAARAKGPEELAHWQDVYKPAPLVAPLDGVIISRDVEPGQSVTSADPVLVMSDRLIVKAQVDETDIARIKVAQQAEINLDAFPDNRIPAKVAHVAYEARSVNSVTVYFVEVLPAKVPEFMRSGMTANVTFTVSRREDVLVLPAEAVRKEDGRDVVLRPNPEGRGRPARAEIKTGITDGKKVEILDGLAEGDKVLVRAFKMPSGGGPGSSPFSPFGGGGRQGGNRQGGGGSRRGGGNQ
jgi:membrane fusion protein, macrolide-specific efflux system